MKNYFYRINFDELNTKIYQSIFARKFFPSQNNLIKICRFKILKTLKKYSV